MDQLAFWKLISGLRFKGKEIKSEGWSILLDYLEAYAEEILVVEDREKLTAKYLQAVELEGFSYVA